jgi:hypothetical protein
MTPRQKAIAAGETQYFTGLPCTKGHISNRQTVNGTCTRCANDKKSAWQKANRDKCNENWQRYSVKNRDKINAKTKEYENKNPGKKIARKAVRRAKEINATPKWLSKEQRLEIQEYYIMAKELEKVFPWKQHVDHIVPLKHDKVCGLHTPWNLQILSAKANMEKSNKFEVA